MKKLFKKASDAELEILRTLWDSDRPLTVAEIKEDVTKRTGWVGSTIKTLVQRLCEKKIIAQEKRDVFYYTPLMDKDEYAEEVTKRLADRLYKDGMSDLVCKLVSVELTSEQADRLREKLKEM